MRFFWHCETRDRTFEMIVAISSCFKGFPLIRCSRGVHEHLHLLLPKSRSVLLTFPVHHPIGDCRTHPDIQKSSVIPTRIVTNFNIQPGSPKLHDTLQWYNFQIRRLWNPLGWTSPKSTHRGFGVQKVSKQVGNGQKTTKFVLLCIQNLPTRIAEKVRN